jgi:hypothetical protein
MLYGVHCLALQERQARHEKISGDWHAGGQSANGASSESSGGEGGSRGGGARSRSHSLQMKNLRRAPAEFDIEADEFFEFRQQRQQGPAPPRLLAAGRPPRPRQQQLGEAPQQLGPLAAQAPAAEGRGCAEAAAAASAGMGGSRHHASRSLGDVPIRRSVRAAALAEAPSRDENEQVPAHGKVSAWCCQCCSRTAQHCIMCRVIELPPCHLCC